MGVFVVKNTQKTISSSSALPLAPLLLVLAAAAASNVVHGEIIISEIADRGTPEVCNGQDWIELYNAADASVDLTGWVLHDDNGADHDNSFAFPVPDVDNEANYTTELLPGSYLLVCTQLEPFDVYPQFGIGGDDTLTLLDPADNAPVASVGPLPDDASRRGFGVTYAWDPSKNEYSYTSTPTPGMANVLTPAVPAEDEAEETVDEMEARLQAQIQQGELFFNMDRRGYPVTGGYAPVLDFYITMDDEDYQYMLENRSFEVYRPFTSAKMMQDSEELISLTSPGRIRPKGQSTLYMATCLDTLTFPMQLDFASGTNASNTLFGIERLYLRQHFGDGSYVRDWSTHRMLARFGLGHVRARHVRFILTAFIMDFIR